MRVALAEDSMLLREGLVRVLEERGFEVVARTDNAQDLLRRVGGLKPDVVLLDIRMPPTHTDDGLQAALELADRHPGLGVVVLTQYVQPEWAMRLLEDGRGGRGYLLKDRLSDLDGLTETIRCVGAGGSVVAPEVFSTLVEEREAGTGRLTRLTARELEILGLMAEGRSNAGISERLVLGRRTVESHVSRIFAKLGLAEAADDHRRVLAVLAYLGERRAA